MEDIRGSIAAVEKALSGQGSYLGLSLGAAAATADREKVEVRKALLAHLQAARERESKLLNEKAKEKAHERERELLLLRLEVQSSEAPRNRSLDHSDGEVEEGMKGGDRRGGTKRKQWGSKGGARDGGCRPPDSEARAPSRRASLPGRGGCAKAFGMKELYGMVMELVGQGEYAFVATVCKAWRGYYIVAHPAKTSQASVVASVERLYWARRHGYELTVETFMAAALHGDVDVCKALHHMGCPWDEGACTAAVRNEHHSRSVLKWLRSRVLPDKPRCPWDESVCEEAALQGKLELVEWLLGDEMNAPFHHGLLQGSIESGRIPVVEWVLHHPKVRAEMEAEQEAEQEGDYDRWRACAGWAAGECGTLEVLQWLHANARELFRWDEQVCEWATGHEKGLSVLKWLRSEEIMCPWDSSCCPQFRSGMAWQSWEDWADAPFKEMKQWIHANGHPCDCPEEQD